MFSLITDYELWNKHIFNEIFNPENEEKEILFCVDEDFIKYIGKKYFDFNENSDLAVENFCRAVASIIYDEEKEQICFDLQNANKIIKGTPYQTGVLAIFILAASNMRRDENYSLKAYYPHLFKLITGKPTENYVYSFITWLNNNRKDFYTVIWKKFENYVEETRELKVNFHNINGAEYENFKIEIPKYHSLISMQDKMDLTLFFDEFKNNENTESDFKFQFLIWNKKNKLSPSAERHMKNQKIREEFLVRIKQLYDNWDERLFFKDSQQNYKKAFPLKLSLEYNNNNLTLFLILKTSHKQLKDRKEIDLIRENKNIAIYKDCGDSFYTPIYININDLNNDIIQFQDKNGFNFAYKRKEDFYIFCRDENGYILEESKISLGQNFQIIYKQDISFDVETSLKEIVGKEFKLKSKIQLGQYIFIPDLKANNYSEESIIKIDKNVKINLIKGLKINDIYLIDAPPNIQILGKFYNVEINNRTIPYSREIDKSCLKCGLNHIKVDDKEIKFNIQDNEGIQYPDNRLFHIFDLNKEQKYLYNGKANIYTENQIAISGNNIYNSEHLNLASDNLIRLSEQQKSKLFYILGLAGIAQNNKSENSISSSNIRADIKNIADFLKQLNENKLYELFNKVFDRKNCKISNLLHFYLSEISKTVGG